jgi:putative pyruvate formate lyase activating enzyme
VSKLQRNKSISGNNFILREDIKEELKLFSSTAYSQCRLCPRNCGVNRLEGQKGYCGETAICRVSYIGPHYGEEPPISGTQGSGTVFFSGCSTRCFFCQNYQISLDGEGREITLSQLTTEVLSVAAKGVHNINLVTPDHFWPHIVKLAENIRKRGIHIPFVFNSSGYEKPSMVAEYAEVCEIFMPDFKYADPSLAQICMGDSNYPGIAMDAIREMVRLRGFLSPWDPSGHQPARQGVLIRHLVLPDHVNNSLQVLRLLKDEFGTGIPISVMSQYTPTPKTYRKGLLTRRITAEEYRRVCEAVIEMGFERVLILSDYGDDLFMPDFNSPVPFKGNR